MFDELLDSQDTGHTKKKSLTLTVSIIIHAVLLVFATVSYTHLTLPTNREV